MTTELFTGAEMVVKALSALKVKYIFGYPGGSVIDIYQNLFTFNSSYTTPPIINHCAGINN